jgi:tol-pal system protein YbgF
MRLSALIPVLFSLACARGEGAEERDIMRMRDALDRASKHNDELEQKLSQSELPRPAPSARKPPDTPQLKVVRIAPDEPEPIADPEENAPRPVVRVVGSGTVRKGRSESVETYDPDPEGAPQPIHSSESRASALDPNARAAYDAALNLVYAKKYDAALDAFASFLMRWPDHPNADNAHYWRGECYAGKGDLPQAETQFQGVLRQFPLGNKIPDSLLKLTLIQEKLGKATEAKASRERLLRDYPKKEAP